MSKINHNTTDWGKVPTTVPANAVAQNPTSATTTTQAALAANQTATQAQNKNAIPPPPAVSKWINDDGTPTAAFQSIVYKLWQRSGGQVAPSADDLALLGMVSGTETLPNLTPRTDFDALNLFAHYRVDPSPKGLSLADFLASWPSTRDQSNITGNAATVTVGDAGGDTTCWVLLGTNQTGNMSPSTDAGLTYNATTHALTATTFIGALTGNVTGNVTGSSGSCTGNAATVTTNANLTGDVTSVGNASTLVTAQPGAHTWAAVQTFTLGPVIANAVYLSAKDSGAVVRRLMGINGSNAVFIGPFDVSWGGSTTLGGGTTVIVKVNGSSGAFSTAITFNADATTTLAGAITNAQNFSSTTDAITSSSASCISATGGLSVAKTAIINKLMGALASLIPSGTTVVAPASTQYNLFDLMEVDGVFECDGVCNVL